MILIDLSAFHILKYSHGSTLSERSLNPVKLLEEQRKQRSGNFHFLWKPKHPDAVPLVVFYEASI